ncbi:hypothetical protein M9Y10_033623 [Tritrichomonas musculus]|uniref:Leucine-rich repeat domain-containing protein n=1 Tax=Tritrichomonas musculus TaxID=1915356 RepID=A0ABR2KDB8_9EUKA
MESSESMVSEQPETQGTVEIESCEYELFIKSGNLYAQLRNVKSDETSLIIPATVEKDGSEYPVQGIAPRALRQSHVESLSFAPDSQVKSLKKDALYCHTLKKVALPASLEALEVGWCNFTLKLVELTIEDNSHFVTQDNALYDSDKTVLYHVARNIKEFTVPASVEKIGSYAFEQCRRLRTLTFEDNSQLKSIEQWAFSHCGLKQIHFPDSLESIGYDAFFHTPRLEEISFGDDSVLKNVLIGAFKDTSLSDVTLPPTTVKIGIAAFQNCPKLEKVTLLNPGTVTIWRDAFTGTTDDFKLVVCENTRLKGAGVPSNVERGSGTSIQEIAQNAIEGLVGNEEAEPAAQNEEAEPAAQNEEAPAEQNEEAPAENPPEEDHPAEEAVNGLVGNLLGDAAPADDEAVQEEHQSEVSENEEKDKLEETKEGGEEQ